MNTAFLRTKMAVAVISSVISGAAGAAVAIKLTTKHLEQKFTELSEREINEAKDFYSRQYKTDEFSTPEGAAAILIPATEKVDKLEQEAAEALVDYTSVRKPVEEKMEDFVTPYPPRESRTEIVTNVFTDAENLPEFDYEEELKRRDPSRPYLVSFDEYMENHTDHDQVTLTYHTDEVLSDDQDKVFASWSGNPEDFDELGAKVGRENLERFGVGSGDSNVVLVRDAIKRIDYEIVRSTGTYKADVLGFTEDEDSLSHSDEPFPPPRRFRNRDF